jgi:NAD(P) transhydrogenase subunit alpha
MKIAVPKETHPGETRTPLIPASVAKLVKLGAQVEVEAGLGSGSGFADADYTAAGATLTTDRKALLGSGDMVLRVRKPPVEEIALLKSGCIHASLLDPFNEKELVQKLAERGVSAISMEFIPRTTRAQKMDVLSSQANLGGYEAVILAARYSNKIFPMMTTAAGTILPSKVFIIGVGVAGLQAIATAKRLGAKVTAYDTRPVVEEQVKSLGAQFLKIDVGETGQTKEGYAKALTEEQIKKQRDAMKKVCGDSDVVITAAQVFGRRAPVLVTAEMLNAMKPGSVVVDLAIETGGNVEGAVLDKVTDRNGVKIVGIANLPGRVPLHASQVYSANLTNLVEEFWDKQNKNFVLKLDDEIIKGCLVTHGGKIVNE